MRTASASAASSDALEVHGDEVTVRLTDDLLSDGVADVRWLLRDALLIGARRVVVDLEAVELLSSPAVASFLSAHRTCRSRGGGVVLRSANRRTLDLLRRTGLWLVLHTEDPRGGTGGSRC